MNEATPTSRIVVCIERIVESMMSDMRRKTFVSSFADLLCNPQLGVNSQVKLFENVWRDFLPNPTLEDFGTICVGQHSAFLRDYGVEACHFEVVILTKWYS
jgi:hypothetical protein